MMKHAEKHILKSQDFEMDYVSFGTGRRKLVLIPGLSLRDVRDSALMLASMYRIFAKDYKVYVFDRRRRLPEGYTVRDMARDTACAMRMLNIENADVFGISQGGMIAQYLAIDSPELVHTIVLGVTASRQNTAISEVVGNWIQMAQADDFETLIMDMMEKIYSQAYIKKYGRFFPALSKMLKPKDPARFLMNARACLTCSSYDELCKIQCPAFVLGGRKDKVVTGEASEEIAVQLGCSIYMYDHLGHSAYEEARDFNSRVYNFLISNL
mgnify:FL=1